jgi:hypothetical protein
MGRTKKNEIDEQEKNKKTAKRQKRCCNWLVDVARLLRTLPKEVVLLCFEFGVDVNDPKVKKKLFDWFDTVECDAKLPPIARELVGLHSGPLPTGGLEFDIELFKMLFFKYISVNIQNEKNPGFVPTLINRKVINPLLPAVFALRRETYSRDETTYSRDETTYSRDETTDSRDETTDSCDETVSASSKTKPPYALYTKAMGRCFRNRWFICEKKGILLAPPPVETFLGPPLKFTTYAIDRNYHKACFEADSTSAPEADSTSESTTTLQSILTIALLSKYSVLREVNPFYPSHDYFL